jgi:hypothetical protein
MNVLAMLADFLEIVTPKSFNKHLLNSLTASLQSLLTNGQCSVTAIGSGIESLAQKSIVLNAQTDCSATPPCNRKSYKEPWLLVSNFAYCFKYAKKINKLYAARMQIEEAFRDQKSQTYGLGSNAHRTKKKSRLEVVLLLAALANWLHYMLGLAAELAGKHTGRFKRIQ